MVTVRFHCGKLSAFLLVVAASGGRPPIFYITASSLYDAGHQHGSLAGNRIRDWFAMDEMQRAFEFVASKPEIFNSLKQRNADSFPELVEEMRGVADGARISLDQIWCANLLPELESFMPQDIGTPIHRQLSSTPVAPRWDHCSDVYAISDQGFSGGFFHGHNEDWPYDSVQNYWYFLAYRRDLSGDARSQRLVPDCAGFVYPGMLLGFAPTWNRHHMYSTMNSVFLNNSNPDGLAAAFVARHSFCKSNSLIDTMTALSVPGWSLGTSANVVDLVAHSMGNLEICKDKDSIVEVSAAVGNYSHFNMYKHPKLQGLDVIESTSFDRQAVLDRQPAPRSRLDIVDRLSDPPILRRITMASFVLDGLAQRLDIWCCGQSPRDAKPIHSLNLSGFFDSKDWDRQEQEAIIFE